jgi:hypothetical protein
MHQADHQRLAVLELDAETLKSGIEKPKYVCYSKEHWLKRYRRKTTISMVAVMIMSIFMFFISKPRPFTPLNPYSGGT